MKRVMVTGAGGYIGSTLAEELLESGYEVVAYDRFFFGEEVLGSLVRNSRLRIRKGDIRSIAERDLEGVHAVCDLAALSNDPSGELDPDLTLDINHRGRARVARLAKKAGVRRYVLASSCSIYGQGAGDALDETAPTAPLTTYAKANLRAEEATLPLADGGFSVTALRNATVFGLSRRMRFDLVVNAMTLSAVQKSRIVVHGGGKQWRPHVHVRDVARAFRAVIEAPTMVVNGQIFNVGGRNARVISIAHAVREVVPAPVQIEVTIEDPDRRDYNVSFDKIARVLGYEIKTTIEAGIAEVYRGLKGGEVQHTPRTSTVTWYRGLLEAHRLVQSYALDGRMLCAFLATPLAAFSC